VTEGLSAIEAGNGPGEHGERDKEEREKKLNRAISMFEAALLALVAVHPHRGYRLTGHRAQAAVKS
jgi:hypothetical protein